MAVLIQSGVRYCGKIYGANDTTWNLMGSTGNRTWAIDTTFPTVFASAPSVNVFIQMRAGNPYQFSKRERSVAKRVSEANEIATNPLG